MNKLFIVLALLALAAFIERPEDYKWDTADLHLNKYVSTQTDTHNLPSSYYYSNENPVDKSYGPVSDEIDLNTKRL